MSARFAGRAGGAEEKEFKNNSKRSLNSIQRVPFRQPPLRDPRPGGSGTLSGAMGRGPAGPGRGSGAVPGWGGRRGRAGPGEAPRRRGRRRAAAAEAAGTCTVPGPGGGRGAVGRSRGLHPVSASGVGVGCSGPRPGGRHVLPSRGSRRDPELSPAPERGTDTVVAGGGRLGSPSPALWLLHGAATAPGPEGRGSPEAVQGLAGGGGSTPRGSSLRGSGGLRSAPGGWE